jgi:hypothetical protein
VLSAAVLLVADVACSQDQSPKDQSPKEETDGGGDLTVLDGEQSVLVKGRVRTGETWSIGAIPLCKSASDVVVKLLDVEPVSVTGSIVLEDVGVRTSAWAPTDATGNPLQVMTASYRGVLPGLQRPSGFVVPTACQTVTGAVGEVIIVATKTGDEGGEMQGLRITYESRGGTHFFTARAGFVLCGSGTETDGC